MDRISAVVITKNEAHNVERCLRSLAPVADEIVVVDDASTDGTRELCERLGARVVTQPWLGYGPQKNLGNGLATHEYVLSVDADEVVDEALQRSVLAEKRRGLAGSYAVARLNWYYGRFLRHGFEYPDARIRLFPRSAAAWDDRQVHEGLVFSRRLPTRRLEGHLLHYAYRTVEEHVAKANRYTTLAAQDAYARGVKVSLARVVLSPLVTFLRSYLWKRGFLDGLHGFALAALHANGTLLKYVKLWRLHRRALEGGGQ
jgi:(heptosyl)LPS beta-1,4-glucosyltransferase